MRSTVERRQPCHSATPTSTGTITPAPTATSTTTPTPTAQQFRVYLPLVLRQ